MLRLVPVLCATALLAASCGGGGDPKIGPDLTSFTANDLAITVLPAEQLAGAAQDLEIDPDQSGFSIVAFRVDRLIAAVVLVRADSADASAQAKTIAASLARRIGDAAAGTIAETPVPLPAVGGPTTAPAGTPSLAGLALSLADLPAGVNVEREGYGEPDADVLARFRRAFDLGTTKIGGSQLVSLEVEVEVELYGEESDATATLLGTEAVLSGAGGKSCSRAASRERPASRPRASTSPGGSPAGQGRQA